MTEQQKNQAITFAKKELHADVMEIEFRTSALTEEGVINAALSKEPRKALAEQIKGAMTVRTGELYWRLSEKTATAVNKSITDGAVSITEVNDLLRKNIKSVWNGYSGIMKKLEVV